MLKRKVAARNVTITRMSEPVTDTRAGKVRGVKVISCEDQEYYSFKGIPFAKPPIGELRFQDPQPLEPWSGIRETTVHGPNCSQYDAFANKFIGSDDCLYLNVYTKNFDDTKSKTPVMVWIHGGAFVLGSGDDSFYGPDYFMCKDIVLVTINYRLGVLGFLNLGDEVASGNQGLKDQVMALQWVRDNIANFGGDPNNVTIFGESAGAASVHYLCISPLARGLFHKAIAQSGVSFNTWAFHKNAVERSYQFCERLGCKAKNAKEAVDFLRTVDCETLIKAQEELVSKKEKLQFIFSIGPSIDDKSKKPFMPVHPEIASEEGVQVPLLIGNCGREGIIFMRELANQYTRFNNEFGNLLHPDSLELLKKYKFSPENFKKLYLNNEEIKVENVDKLLDLLGDLYFVVSIHKVVKTQVEKSSAPTYLYRFTYDKDPSPMKTLWSGEHNISGATHADDLIYMFRAHMFDGMFEKLKKGTSGYKLMERMIELWTNFAFTGRPTPSPTELVPFYWQPVNNEQILRHLNIAEDLRMEVTINLEQHYTAHKIPSNKL